MKKSVAKIISLALVLVCMLSLAACGGGGSDAAGTYRLQTIEMAGFKMDLPALASFAGVSEDDLKMDLELKSDGSFNLDMSAFDQSMSMDGTWKSSGKNVTLTTSDNEAITATLDGKTLIMSEGSGDEAVSITFEKK